MDQYSKDLKVKCHFKLVDFNEETLNFAVNQVKEANKSELCSITGEIQSVLNLVKKSVNQKCETSKYDLVYCSGLFDYLSDQICSKLVKMFYEMLTVGGKVHVTNMHSDDICHPNDNFMQELLFEWYLIYRNEKQMSKLFPDVSKQKIYTDPTGINLCLEISK